MLPLFSELLNFFVPLIVTSLGSILLFYIYYVLLIKYHNYPKETAYKISLKQYIETMAVLAILNFIKVFLHFQFNIIQWTIISILIIELIKQIINKK